MVLWHWDNIPCEAPQCNSSYFCHLICWWLLPNHLCSSSLKLWLCPPPSLLVITACVPRASHFTHSQNLLPYASDPGKILPSLPVNSHDAITMLFLSQGDESFPPTWSLKTSLSRFSAQSSSHYEKLVSQNLVDPVCVSFTTDMGLDKINVSPSDPVERLTSSMTYHHSHSCQDHLRLEQWPVRRSSLGCWS